MNSHDITVDHATENVDRIETQNDGVYSEELEIPSYKPEEDERSHRRINSLHSLLE